MSQWDKHIRGRLEDIRQWRAAGMDHQAIAKSLGLRESVLERLAREHVSLQDALEGPQLANAAVEEALMRIAVGHTVTDRTFEMRDNGDGERRMRMIKKVVRQREPELAAVRMWLQGRAPERWGEAEAAHPTPDALTLIAQAKQLLNDLEAETAKPPEAAV